jgi:hypothetical protein
MSTMRGHQAQLKLFSNGAPLAIVDFTNVQVNQDSSFSRTFLVGKAVPEGDQTQEGWSGSCELEVRDSSVDDYIDAIIANNLAGIGVDESSFVITENYPDGRSKSWAYYDVQWKMGRKQAGLNEKITKTLEFQASGRIAL